MANTIRHIQVVRRPNEADILLSWQTRDATTDGLYQWNGTGWTLLQALVGTGLIYSSCTMQNKVYWADGKNKIQVWKPDTDEICELNTDAPVVQYLIVYQSRIVGAGDARTKAEIEGAGLVWPADSNRLRVIFSEALDDQQWPANNFIDADIGNGEVISGLGINSITSSDKGAQSQLVVFTPTSTQVNNGVLNAAEQTLNVVSNVIGCPGYHSIVNTPFGLMFCAKETVCMLGFDGHEPHQVGYPVSPTIKDIPEAYQAWTAAFFHDNIYKLSYNSATTKNNRELWLDLKPQVFPNEQNWYGPHTGDFILQYELFEGLLIGAEYSTTTMWQLDVEGNYGSMSAPSTARTQVMTWPRFQAQNIHKGIIDAYGFRGTSDVASALVFTETLSFDQGAETTQTVFTSPVDDKVYNVARPIRKTKYDAQPSISHQSDDDFEVQSIYLRTKLSRRQAESQAGSSQVNS